MTWFEKIMPSRIKTERRTRSVPEGLWIKCPACETVLYRPELEQNLHVCPKCAHHMRIGARERLDAFLDPERPVEIGQEVAAGRHAQVQGQQEIPRAPGRGAEERPARPTRWSSWAARCEGIADRRRRFEFDFMGGSMGSVVGERFVRGVEHAIEHASRSSASPRPAARACRKGCCR